MSTHKHSRGKLRFFHNVIDGGNVNVIVNGRSTRSVENLEYKDLTSYLTVPIRSDNVYKISVRDAITDEVIVRKKVKIKTKYMTIILTSVPDGTRRIISFPDYLNKPNYGYSYIRFIHISPNIPSVDVYINNRRMCHEISYNETGYPIYHNHKLTGDLLGSIKVVINRTVIVSSKIYITSRSVITIFLIGASDNEQFPPSLIIGQDNGSDTYRLDKLEPNFSIQDYMGKWYHIAYIEESKKDQLITQYTYLQNQVKALDTGGTGGTGGVGVVGCSGTLEQFDQRYPGVFIETYSILKRWTFKGKSQDIIPLQPNYIIHKTDYISYALIGSPARNSLYILSRYSKMKDKRYQELLKEAEYLGYNVSHL